jgi:hypothetical protein
MDGHGVRGGRAMIATLRCRPGPAGTPHPPPDPRLPPGHGLLPEVLARLRELPDCAGRCNPDL